jgi:TolA-binding protein
VRHTLGAGERSARPLGWRRPVAIVASIGAVLLLGSGLVTAAFWVHLRNRPPSPTPTTGRSEHAPITGARTRRAAADLPAPALLPREDPPSHVRAAVVSAPAGAAHRGGASVKASSVAAAADHSSGDVAAEVALFTTGLRQLRHDRDREAAIATFHDYARRFPAGLFRNENRAALVEALVAAHRIVEALALVEAEPLASGERGRADQVLRGELRARLERCPAAIEDFDGVLATTRADADAAAGRALFGRAVCGMRLGRTEAARADLTTYLRGFPNGRFAAEARRLLAP